MNETIKELLPFFIKGIIIILVIVLIIKYFKKNK